ncbi:hypothetical protein AWZ03_011874 [Drosophila navojoa]|uniref:VM domain-containing protein n=1 Tax=Drosophila navojoa TaxID=7232 RepID=A0A484AZ41_DRONA|nr:hypothetical protein AWZ03_011874 [Drosophila navojoa]
MKPSTGIWGIALTALLACTPSLAVVHGIQPLSAGPALASAGHGNGYRYNGPAHKYLPPASELTTEAITTTGHWQPNPVQQPAQQLPFEHTYDSSGNSISSSSSSSSNSISDYHGPYRMEYYERAPMEQRQQQHQQHQQHQPQQQLNMNNFQFAADNSGAAAAAAAAQFGQAVGLSAGAQHDRRLESGQRGAQLIGQALPERYQRQPFAQPSSSYLQMQSHSYELPPSYSVHREWYEQEAKPQPQQQQTSYYEQEQQQQQQLLIQQQQQQQQLLIQQQQQQQQLLPQVHHHFDYSQQLSSFHDHAHTQNAHVAQPSREFLAPYY